MRAVMRVSAKELVEQAVHELFGRRDATAVDRYWSPDYIEHSIVGADGLQGLRDLAGSLPEGFRHVRARVLAERRSPLSICGGSVAARLSSTGMPIKPGPRRRSQAMA